MGLGREPFSTPMSQRILAHLLADRFAYAVTVLGARLAHDEGDQAGEYERRHSDDDDQKSCVASHIGPIRLVDLGWIPVGATDNVVGAHLLKVYCVGSFCRRAAGGAAAVSARC